MPIKSQTLLKCDSMADEEEKKGKALREEPQQSPLLYPVELFKKRGLIFVPTDEHLALHYLLRKVSGKTPQGMELYMREVPLDEVYGSAPSEDKLDACGVRSSTGNAWFFFTKKNEEHMTNYGSIREIGNGNGYWKVVTSQEGIRDTDGNIGAYKTKLAFFSTRQQKGTSGGQKKDIKTNWVLEEYQLAEAFLSAKLTKNNVYILGKISRAMIVDKCL